MNQEITSITALLLSMVVKRYLYAFDYNAHQSINLRELPKNNEKEVIFAQTTMYFHWIVNSDGQLLNCKTKKIRG